MTQSELVIERLREARELAQALEQEVLLYMIDMALIEAIELFKQHAPVAAVA